MKRRTPIGEISIILLCALLLSFGSTPSEDFSFAQIFNDGEPRLLRPLPSLIGWLDNQNYLISKKEGSHTLFYSVSLKTGKETLYLDLREFQHLPGKTLNLKKPLTRNPNRTLWVYEQENDLFLLDTEKREWRRLTHNPQPEKTPCISPDERWLAFTRGNDLFAVDLITGKEHRLTADGSEHIFNGYASWVYYEEIFGRATNFQAFWWSPDSRFLLFFRFDNRNVPFFPLYNSEGQHGSLETAPYPMAGDPNPKVKIGVTPVGREGKISWADFDENEDQYFGTPFWHPDSKTIIIQWLNRGQDHFRLYLLDPFSGKKKEIYEERQKSWIDWQEDISFFAGGRRFIIKSDRTGWSHFYSVDMDGKEYFQITRGDWNTLQAEEIRQNDGTLFFTANKETSTRTDLYSIRVDGTGLTRLTSGPYSHSVLVSPDTKHFLTTYSSLNLPPRQALHRADGSLVRALQDSQTTEYRRYNLAKAQWFTIPTSDGWLLPAYWHLPLSFDPQKKYPVLLGIYGGPGSKSVSDTWKGLSIQWLAKEGIIQISVDHRGSGHFGKKGTALMHRCLGKWEMNDYIETVKWLRTQPFVDTGKICITGGSYGGYLTSLALTYGSDFFTHGIADFPVTSWELYDSHYTERYMDLPAENPEGYRFGSVLTHIDKYRSGLSIVHGTMDNNVHMQHTLQLIDKLQNLNRPFELMLYPGERHGWRGVKGVHSRGENYRFYYRYLLEKPFPEELFRTLKPQFKENL